MNGFQRVSPAFRSQMPTALVVPAGASPAVGVAPCVFCPGRTRAISTSCSR
jgi:hypothetical protein